MTVEKTVVNTQVEKAVEKKENQQVVNDFVQRSTMTWQDKTKCDICKTTISKNVSRSGFESYALSFIIPCANNQEVVIDFKPRDTAFGLNRTKFEIIKAEWKKEDTEKLVMNIPFRLIKGKTSTDENYYRFELFVSPSVTLADMFKTEEVKLLSLKKPVYKFINNTNVISLETLLDIESVEDESSNAIGSDL